MSVALTIEYFLLSELADKFLKDNPKLHDIGKIAESIQRYGFRDPLAIDQALNEGRGGIAEGNGRLEALLWMKQQKQSIPAYIKLTESEQWAVPCIIGGDSDTEAEGLAYSLDHNSLTMAGGSFTALDISGLYNQVEYTELLEKLAQSEALPIAVDGDDLDLLLEQIGTTEGEVRGDGATEENPEYSNTGYKGKFPITIIADKNLHARWVTAMEGCDRNSPESVLSMILDEAGY